MKAREAQDTERPSFTRGRMCIILWSSGGVGGSCERSDVSNLHIEWREAHPPCISELFAKQDIGKIVEGVEISPSEALELQQAEALMRAFLKWDLSDEGKEAGRTMEALAEMLEEANRIQGNDAT
jgi:hypothetical protein